MKLIRLTRHVFPQDRGHMASMDRTVDAGTIRVIGSAHPIAEHNAAGQFGYAGLAITRILLAHENAPLDFVVDTEELHAALASDEEVVDLRDAGDQSKGVTLPGRKRDDEEAD